MGRLFAEIWMLCVVSFLAGAVLTWLVFFRPRHRARRRWRDGVPAVATTPSGAPESAAPGPAAAPAPEPAATFDPVPRPIGDPAGAGPEPSRRAAGNGVPAPPGPPPVRRRPG